MSLYFAYGSNINPARMRGRCPSARPLGVGTLRGWGLRFVGGSRTWGGAVADIAERGELENPPRGLAVRGVVWDLPFAEVCGPLDRAEGHPFCYQRIRVNVRLDSGRTVRAWAYIKVDDVEIGPPAPAYFRAIASGYLAHGLDLEELVAAVVASTPGRGAAPRLEADRARLAALR